MTPITWIFCLAVLWTKAMGTQVDTVPPLIMAVYGKGESRRITLTDGTAVNADDLKLPLDKTEPTFTALLCIDDSNPKNFQVMQVTNEIDSIHKELKCSTHPEQGEVYILEDEPLFKDFIINVLSQKSVGIWNGMKKKMNISGENQYAKVQYLRIQFHGQLMIPVSTTYKVIAHMYSNESTMECINNVTLNKKYGALVPHGFQRRQLVPMEDFKCIYTTKITCTYMNCILLHDDASKSLKSIEIFTRKVADVINEVSVVSGTYIKINDHSILQSDGYGNAIPTIVWKKISYKMDNTHYAVLVVIHNQKTERFCDKVDRWGWPEHNREGKIRNHKENSEKKLAIGTMYYCLMNMEISISNKSGIKDTPYSPFNLHEVQHKGKAINVLKKIEANDSSSKTEQ